MKALVDAAPLMIFAFNLVVLFCLLRGPQLLGLLCKPLQRFIERD